MKSGVIKSIDYWIKLAVIVPFLAFFNQACTKFVQVDPPDTNLISETVFREDVTAIAAMNSVYSLMTSSGFSAGSAFGITFLSGLSSDEFQLYGTLADHTLFSTNSLTQSSGGVGIIWSSAYATIYRANAIIEGVRKSTTLSHNVRLILEGEAKFVRAFSFFYLANLYGNVPLSVTTDYRVNSIMPVSSIANVYKQIVLDLKDAQDLLLNDFSFSAGERVKVNKWGATALLARVYLYLRDWVNAELESSKLIDNTSMFKLLLPKDVFFKNSMEAIWQLSNNNLNTNEANLFIFATKPGTVALTDTLFKSFSENDLRKSNWIIPKTSGGTTYYQLSKYKAPTSPPVTNPITQPVEYSMVLRLAEQFLIRAEARAQQGNITGLNSAASDLNVIRIRAGLLETDASTKPDMLLAVEKERKLELFGEWGHRWLDLKRTNRADAVLRDFKGSNWQSTDQLYPIPEEQLLNNPSMRNSQNPGYN